MLSEDLSTTTPTIGEFSVGTAGTINLAKGGGAVDGDITEVSAGVLRWKDADAETNFNGNADTTGGGVAPLITFADTASVFQDAAGNNMADFTNLSVSDAAAPILLTANIATKTTGTAAGKTDTMVLRYSEDVSTSSNTVTDYIVELLGAATAITVDSVGRVTNTITLNLNLADTDQTTGAMQVTYAGTIIVDAATLNGAAKTDQAITD